MILKETLAAAIQAAAEKARAAGTLTLDELPPVHLDVPPTPELGDYSSDVAVRLARLTRQSAGAVADALAAQLDLPAGLVERVDVLPSGFLNFHLPSGWLDDAIAEASRSGEDWGRSRDVADGGRVLVEFVSADPTAHLSVSHGRGAVLGDVLSHLLEWNGLTVTREFYVNDAGSQAERFARALDALYPDALRNAAPAAGKGEDELAADVAAELARSQRERLLALDPGARLSELARLGQEAVLRRQRETLERLGVRFDQWRSERDLHEAGAIQRVLERLEREGHTYDYEGALWLRTTAFGDYVDRPLRRSNGKPTYLAADLAYHLDKFERGFQRLVDVWGPEHETYIPRTKAGLRALGCAADALEILVFQPVTLEVDGLIVEGAPSSGNNRTLDAVIEKVGTDVARFFYLSRRAGSPLHFNLDQAQSPGNAATAFLRAAERARGLATPGTGEGAPGHTPSSLALARLVAAFPDEVRSAARSLDPSRLVRYAIELTTAFDATPTGEGVGGEKLVRAVANTFTNLQTILGVGAPAPARG